MSPKSSVEFVSYTLLLEWASELLIGLTSIEPPPPPDRDALLTEWASISMHLCTLMHVLVLRLAVHPTSSFLIAMSSAVKAHQRRFKLRRESQLRCSSIRRESSICALQRTQCPSFLCDTRRDGVGTAAGSGPTMPAGCLTRCQTPGANGAAFDHSSECGCGLLPSSQVDGQWDGCGWGPCGPHIGSPHWLHVRRGISACAADCFARIHATLGNGSSLSAFLPPPYLSNPALGMHPNSSSRSRTLGLRHADQTALTWAPFSGPHFRATLQSYTKIGADVRNSISPQLCV